MLWFWIIFFIMSCIGAKVSLMSNQYGGKWFITLCLMSAVPYFPLISLWSKNILTDSLIYDVVVLVAYTGIYLIYGTAKIFNVFQWLGLVLTIVGILLMKSKG